jgi:aspartyl-tRNA(Asn)/glutamyl-tRNA(Gln) amidotransferase subunit C
MVLFSSFPGRRTALALTEAQVATIAHLARLEIRSEDVSGYCDRLSRILDFVAQLEQVDTSDVPPMTYAENAAQRLRADEPDAAIDRDRLQANASAVEAGLYLVPKVIE